MRRRRKLKEILTPGKLFFILAILLAGFGFLTKGFLGNSALDIPLHDTYFVIAHFHILIVLAIISIAFGMVYLLYPLLFKGRSMNKVLGQIHFWLTAITSFCIFVPMYKLGMSAVPRRYYSFNEFDSLDTFSDLNALIVAAFFVLIFAQLLFALNFIYSLFRGFDV